MIHTSGAGLPLPSVYALLFGPGKNAKAFRSLVKVLDSDNPNQDEISMLVPMATPSILALVQSQEFKTRWNDYGAYKLSWTARDAVSFIQTNRWLLPDIKKFLERSIGAKEPKTLASTKKFLREWVNTNSRRTPTPDKETIRDLLPFRLQTTKILYRGIRFSNVGELVHFHEKYGAGKSFPFESNRFSSWTTSQDIASKFGRYTSAVSQTDAMMGFFSRMKKQKDYDGNGGYVIGARISPEDTLVDLNHPGLSVSGQHGNEGEVIVRPNTPLVAKVYQVFGDVLREVEDYLKDPYESKKGPITDTYFLGYLGTLMVVAQTGDDDSGTLTFANIGRDDKPLPETPKSKSKDIGLENRFRARLFTMKWRDDYTLEYQRMTLPQRVAFRHNG